MSDNLTDEDIDYDNENEYENDRLIEEFISDLDNFYEQQLKDFENYKKNPTKVNLKSFKLKYPHIKKKLGKNTKLNTIKNSTISIVEFLTLTNTRPMNEKKYSDEWIVGNCKNKQVFDFKYFYCNDEKQFFVIMNFYENHKVIGISIPKGKNIEDYGVDIEKYLNVKLE